MPARWSHSTVFPTTRATLIARLRDPAARAWDEFFRIYGPIIFRMGRRSGLAPTDAEELVGTVMKSFLGSVCSGFELDAGKGHFRHYLRTITNRAVRAQRRRLALVARAASHLVESAGELTDGRLFESENRGFEDLRILDLVI